MMNAPDQYGVVGHPISHSWSPFIHGLFAKQTDQSLVYRLYDIAPGNFRAQVLEFFTRGGRGLNVTVPHKEAAAELANDLTSRADRAGAVNTLVLNDDNTLLGDNTDGHGLVTDLRKNLKLDVTNERLLILGAGGATRGVVEPLLALGPTELVIANRSPERAVNLASLFSDLGPVRGCGFEDLDDRPFDIVINATAAGLSGSVPRGTFRCGGSRLATPADPPSRTAAPPRHTRERPQERRPPGDSVPRRCSWTRRHPPRAPRDG